MNTFIETLKAHIEQNPPNYGDGESILTLLYEAYSDINKMDNDAMYSTRSCCLLWHEHFGLSGGQHRPAPRELGFPDRQRNNQPVSLYPLMDFNMSFQTYDELEGANCQTVIPRKLTQREAAIEAVQAIGLRQIRDVDLAIFDGMDQEREMFLLRFAELKKYTRAN